MLRRFYSVEAFLGCGDFSTKQRIFNEEKAFLRCEELSTMGRLSCGVDSFLGHGNLCKMWTLFYDAETF